MLFFCKVELYDYSWKEMKCFMARARAMRDLDFFSGPRDRHLIVLDNTGLPACIED